MIKNDLKKEKRALMLANTASMIDQFNLSNISILQSLGYDVDVAANFTEPGTITGERAAKVRKQLIGTGVRVIDLPIPKSLNPVRMFRAYRNIRKEIDQRQYDLIHCHSPIGGAITRVAARRYRLLGTKVIYTAHGFHFYKGAPVLNWLLYYPVERWLSRYTDALITINREDYQRAKMKFRANRILYVPGIGIDTEKFGSASGNQRIRKEFQIPEEAFLLLSVGELNTNKNHQLIIRAMSGNAKNDNLYYLIVGRGRLKHELQALAERYGIGSYVKFAGYREDIPEFYEAADLFVFPSFREGLSVSLMEAMASGLPVVCSRIRGNVDLIDEGKGGFFFDPGSYQDAADAIRKAVGVIRMDSFGDYNQKKVKLFSSSSINKTMEQLYISMIR